MFWERLLRFLKGYVEFRAVGGFPERFINLCAANRISVQEIKMFGDTILGVCGIKDYARIRMVAKKSGMKVRILKKTGLPFFVRKNRMRSGIIVGLFLMIIITLFLSGRIWVINVSGNEKMPAEEILSCFEDMGIKTGIKKDSINPKEKAFEAMEKIDGLMWCAVNVDGCKIGIEIKEQIEKEIEEKDEIPSNIVASKSGQIKVIECFIGTPVSESGSAVEKGDIIVSGAVINKDESVSFYKAKANVIAKTKNTVSASVSSAQQMRVYTKIRNRYFIDFFSLHFPVNFLMGQKGKYNFSVDENFMSAGKNKLPLGITTERYSSYENRNIKLDKACMKLMCAEAYFRKIDEDFDEIQTDSVASEITENENSVCITSVFECTENIAMLQKMDIVPETVHNE